MKEVLFNDLGINPKILLMLKSIGFSKTTPVQAQSIIPALAGKDLTVQAPTGTGKTCAFAIPLVQNINSSRALQGLVLCPTRELVLQTTLVLQKLTENQPGIKTVAVYGGQPISKQISALRRNPQIIVATPGRLRDHLRRRTVDLNSLKILVLDEADHMLDMGFREELDDILLSVPAKRQTLLFSATISKDILAIAKTYQNKPEIIKIAQLTKTVDSVSQFFLQVQQKSKPASLGGLISMHPEELALVFVNTKVMADKLSIALRENGLQTAALHGDMRQNDRDKVMRLYRSKRVQVLVATDVAARGIDVDDIDLVVNFDIPNDDESYVHRIGRTGRATKTGNAVSLITPGEQRRLRSIMKATGANIVALTNEEQSEIKQFAIDNPLAIKHISRPARKNNYSKGQKRGPAGRGGYGNKASSARPKSKRNFSASTQVAK